MYKIKNIVKSFIGRVFRYLFPLFSGLENINIVLAYHRIVENTPKGFHDPFLFVRANTFEMHLKEIAAFFNVSSIKELNQSKKRDARLCTITFDDGWIDNYEIAFPLLRKYKMPATIFVPVDVIGTNHSFWFEKVFHLANMSVSNNCEKVFIQYFHNIIPSWQPQNISNDSLLNLISALKSLPANSLDNLVEMAYNRLNVTIPLQNAIMNWDQVLEMGKYGINFGSHGLQHCILPTLKKKLKRENIFSSIKQLKNKHVSAVPFFAYPNGNWDEESIDFLSKAGYLGAFTTQLGYNTSKTHPFLLNRVLIHEYNSQTSDLFWFTIFQAFCSTYRLFSFKQKKSLPRNKFV